MNPFKEESAILKAAKNQNGFYVIQKIINHIPEKCDVVEKYKEKEIAKLKKSGEIPESMVLPSSSEAENKDDGDADILFEEHDEEVISKKKGEFIWI